MITFAPSDYVETPEESFERTKSFINSMKEKKVRYFVYIKLEQFKAKKLKLRKTVVNIFLFFTCGRCKLFDSP